MRKDQPLLGFLWVFLSRRPCRVSEIHAPLPDLRAFTVPDTLMSNPRLLAGRHERSRNSRLLSSYLVSAANAVRKYRPFWVSYRFLPAFPSSRARADTGRRGGASGVALTRGEVSLADAVARIDRAFDRRRGR